MLAVGKDVLIVGGRGPHGNRCSRFDYQRKRWLDMPVMLEGMVKPIAAEMRGTLYIIFNRIAENMETRSRIDTPMTYLELLPILFQKRTNQTKHKWIEKEPCPADISTSGASAIGHENSIFVVGGIHGVCLCYSELECGSNSQSTNINPWTIYDSKPNISRHGGFGILVKDTLVLMGGFEGETWAATIEEVTVERGENQVPKIEYQWKISEIKFPKGVLALENKIFFPMSNFRRVQILDA